LDTVQTIALVAGIAWASGINLYITILILGLLGHYEYIGLPAQLNILSEPMVMIAAGIMCLTEFVVDKIPGIDSLWDALHTFIRIPAGALLSMLAVAGTDPALELTALILGGTLAAGTHTSKSATRLMMQSSPEPISNWTASIAEDFLVVAGIWTALSQPWIFLAMLTLFICIMIWLLPKLLSALKHTLRVLKDLIAGSGRSQKPAPLITDNYEK
jgi:hypothetical protein